MKVRASLAIAATLMLATGIGTATLANKAKTNAEEATCLSTGGVKAKIESLMKPQISCPRGCYYLVGYGCICP